MSTEEQQKVRLLLNSLNDTLYHSEEEMNITDSLKKICKVGDKQIIPVLLDFSYNDNPAIREIVIICLGLLKATIAVDMLICSALNDNVPSIRKVALWALGQIADRIAIKPIISIACDETIDVTLRQSAINALRNYRENDVAECLIGLLKDDNPHIRIEVIDSLSNMTSSKNLLDALCKVVLCRNVQNKYQFGMEEAVRQRAAVILGRFHDSHVLPCLLDAHANDGVAVRIGVTIALGDLNDSRMNSKLIRIFDDAINNLLELHSLSLPDSDHQLYRIYRVFRDCAAISLGKLGDPHGLDVLLEIINSEWYANEETDVYIESIKALVTLKEYKAIPFLIKVMWTIYTDVYEEELRNEAQIALHKLTGQNFGQNYNDWKEWWNSLHKENPIV